MMLSHQSIRRYIQGRTILVSPLPTDEQFQPCTLDLRIDIDSLQPKVVIESGRINPSFDRVVIEPSRLYLACTKERIGLPPNLAGQLMGRSSLARLGLVVHQTGGFIDPGFVGNITLEISSVDRPVTIVRDQRICQLGFYLLDEPTVSPYRGKYQGNTGVQESRVHLDVERGKR